jgi:uncharacterized membrane protein YfcA
MSDLARLGLAAGAALAAGAVNAIAGGGSLITFPALVAIGLPAVVANLTNTVALAPGFVGATLAQRRDLAGQGRRLSWMLPVAAAAGVAGGLLLLHTGEAAFKAIVPYLILVAAVALIAQGRLRTWLVARSGGEHSEGWAIAVVALASVYGGYFGAAMGVMLLAALAIVIGDSLTRLNALKQTISLTVNVSAAVLFAASGQVDWPIAGVMLAASLVGGTLGGAVASRIPPVVLRWVIVVLAVVVASVYLASDAAAATTVRRPPTAAARSVLDRRGVNPGNTCSKLPARNSEFRSVHLPCCHGQRGCAAEIVRPGDAFAVIAQVRHELRC